jgi:drug/metabolite transporter (DMT)-like permease
VKEFYLKKQNAMLLFIAFLSPIFYALALLIESRLSNRIFKHQCTMIFYISLMIELFAPMTLFFGTPSWPTGVCMFFYLLLALLDIALLYPYYTAMKVIDTSIIAALFSLGDIFIPVLSIALLNEYPTLHQWIGFMIVIMASVALSLKNSTKIPKLNRAFWYMALASVLLAAKTVLVKYVILLDGNWVNMLLYPSIFSGILPFILLAFSSCRRDIIKRFPHYKQRIPFFALNEFLCFLGLACSTYGLSKLSPVVSSSISSTQPIFLLGFSGLFYYLFHLKLYEKITTRILLKKLFFFVLIILGVILVV